MRQETLSLTQLDTAPEQVFCSIPISQSPSAFGLDNAVERLVVRRMPADQFGDRALVFCYLP